MEKITKEGLIERNFQKILDVKSNVFGFYVGDINDDTFAIGFDKTGDCIVVWYGVAEEVLFGAETFEDLENFSRIASSKAGERLSSGALDVEQK